MKKRKQTQKLQQQQEINWLPLSQLPLIARLIDEAVADTENQHHLATEQRLSFDDNRIPRLKKIRGDELQTIGFFGEQIERWKKETLALDEQIELMRLSKQCERLVILVTEIVALAKAREQETQTMDKILSMDDAELGLKFLTHAINPPAKAKHIARTDGSHERIALVKDRKLVKLI